MGGFGRDGLCDKMAREFRLARVGDSCKGELATSLDVVPLASGTLLLGGTDEKTHGEQQRWLRTPLADVAAIHSLTLDRCGLSQKREHLFLHTDLFWGTSLLLFIFTSCREGAPKQRAPKGSCFVLGGANNQPSTGLVSMRRRNAEPSGSVATSGAKSRV